MVTPAAEDVATAEPARTRRGRWLAGAIIAVLAVVYLTAIKSTHVTMGQAGQRGTGIIGFSMHNGGPVPITLLSVESAQAEPPDVVAALLLGPAGDVSPSSGQMAPFHPVTLGPGGTVEAEFTERIWSYGKYGAYAIAGPIAVVVRYRVLGVTMSRTLSVSARG